MRRRTRAAPGITFVEILLATVIMAAVILPLASLIFGGMSGTEETRNFNTGINVATDIMEKVLSTQVPYTGIVPDGGPSTTLSYGGSYKQAAFATAYQDLEKQLLSDAGDPSDRTITRHNMKFETYFFAGRYADKITGDQTPGGPGTNYLTECPDPREELTFCHFKKPYIKLEGNDRLSVFLPVARTPYNSPGEAYTSNEEKDQNNARDQRCMAAWPYFDKPDKVPEPADIVQIFENAEFHGDYKNPLVIMDQKQLQVREGGGLMKVIVGVRWAPRTTAFKGPGYAKQSREFWLVSVKADLEDS